MFDGNNSSILASGLVRNHAIAEANRGAAEQAASDAWAWKRRADSLRAALDERDARIAELELSLAVKSAGAAAARAQLDAFKAQHPASPLLADSGRRSATGSAKPRTVLIGEQAFDALLRTFGIARPEQYRQA